MKTTRGYPVEIWAEDGALPYPIQGRYQYNDKWFVCSWAVCGRNTIYAKDQGIDLVMEGEDVSEKV